MHSRLVATVAVVFCAMIAVGAAASVEPCTLYVATTGSDTSGSGNVTAPFATLDRALNATGSAMIPIGGTLTICFQAGTYQTPGTAANGRWNMPCGAVAYTTLVIRSAAADAATVILRPAGYLISICRSFILSYLTISDQLTVEIASGAAAGVRTDFDNLLLTGGAQVTWDADHDQASVSTQRQRSIVRGSGRAGSSDDYPFYFTNSKLTALSLQSTFVFVLHLLPLLFA